MIHRIEKIQEVRCFLIKSWILNQSSDTKTEPYDSPLLNTDLKIKVTLDSLVIQGLRCILLTGVFCNSYV